MSSNNPKGEDFASPTEPIDLATVPPADLIHLLAWTRNRRRLWLLAVPGIGLIVL